MRSHGWTSPFRAQPWDDIRVFLGGIADRHHQFRHMVAIVDSVRASVSRGQFAACTSIHDLIVVTTPIPDPPYDVIAVRSPVPWHPPVGTVIIEHRSCTGHNDRIQRPVDDAVPLFWRFVIEKYGVSPNARGEVPTTVSNACATHGGSVIQCS